MSAKEPAASYTPIPGAVEGSRLIPEASEKDMTLIEQPSPNAGKEVVKMEVIGSVVDAPVAKQLNLLHLNEVITYKDGAVDVVGYFPPPSSRSTMGESAPLYADRASASSFDALPKDIQSEIKDGRTSHYSIDINPALYQSLTQTAAAQDHQWQQYNKNPLPYDPIGEIYHNSNGALNASFRAVGRDDVSRWLVYDLATEKEHALQNRPFLPGSTADRAELTLAADRYVNSQRTAPGVSNPPTVSEIEGRGERNIGHALSRQATVANEVLSIVSSGLRELNSVKSAVGAAVDRTKDAPANIRREFLHGLDHFIDQQMFEQLKHHGVTDLTPWNGRPREGRIVYSDDRVAILGTGRGQGVVLGVQEHLGGNQPPGGALVSVASDGLVTRKGAMPRGEVGRG